MELLAELALDHLRHPRRTPQFGGKTELARRVAKPLQDLAFLAGDSFGGRPGCGLAFNPAMPRSR